MKLYFGLNFAFTFLACTILGGFGSVADAKSFEVRSMVDREAVKSFGHEVKDRSPPKEDTDALHRFRHNVGAGSVVDAALEEDPGRSLLGPNAFASIENEVLSVDDSETRTRKLMKKSSHNPTPQPSKPTLPPSDQCMNEELERMKHISSVLAYRNSNEGREFNPFSASSSPRVASFRSNSRETCSWNADGVLSTLGSFLFAAAAFFVAPELTAPALFGLMSTGFSFITGMFGAHECTNTQADEILQHFLFVNALKTELYHSDLGTFARKQSDYQEEAQRKGSDFIISKYAVEDIDSRFSNTMNDIANSCSNYVDSIVNGDGNFDTSILAAQFCGQVFVNAYHLEILKIFVNDKGNNSCQQNYDHAVRLLHDSIEFFETAYDYFFTSSTWEDKPIKRMNCQGSCLDTLTQECFGDNCVLGFFCNWDYRATYICTPTNQNVAFKADHQDSLEISSVRYCEHGVCHTRETWETADYNDGITPNWRQEFARQRFLTVVYKQRERWWWGTGSTAGAAYWYNILKNLQVEHQKTNYAQSYQKVCGIRANIPTCTEFTSYKRVGNGQYTCDADYSRVHFNVGSLESCFQTCRQLQGSKQFTYGKHADLCQCCGPDEDFTYNTEPPLHVQSVPYKMGCDSIPDTDTCTPPDIRTYKPIGNGACPDDSQLLFEQDTNKFYNFSERECFNLCRSRDGCEFFTYLTRGDGQHYCMLCSKTSGLVQKEGFEEMQAFQMTCGAHLECPDLNNPDPTGQQYFRVNNCGECIRPLFENDNYEPSPMVKVYGDVIVESYAWGLHNATNDDSPPTFRIPDFPSPHVIASQCAAAVWRGGPNNGQHPCVMIDEDVTQHGELAKKPVACILK